MKLKNIFLSILLVFSSNIFASDINIIEGETYFSITNKNLSEFSFINSVSDVTTMIVKTEEGEFVKLVVPAYGSDSKDGDAELPVLQKLIRVPFGSEIVVKIINLEEKIIKLSDYGFSIPVFPNQPSVSKNATDIPFYFNQEYYNLDKFTGNNIVETKLLGKMRGQQLARLSVSPFSYNPTTNELKVVTKVEVKVIFKNIDINADNANRIKYYSPEFESLFKTCVNNTPITGKDVITTYPVKYVIISDPQFQAALQPLVDWKIKKGFMVVEEYTNNPSVTTPVNYFNGTLYGDFQTVNAQSTYGLYDMTGNLEELVTIDAACYDSYNECGDTQDPENQPVNSIGLSGTWPYLSQRIAYNTSGGYGSMANLWSMFSWQGVHPGVYEYERGFRCARTITGN